MNVSARTFHVEKSTPRTFRSGDRLAHYELDFVLGEGGMGQVWAAVDTELQRRVALKVVRPDRANPRQEELLQREARAGARLQHPHIVSIFGFGWGDEDTAWIAMERVDGASTLHDSLVALRGSEVPTGYDDHVATFALEIAQALAFAHREGVIHRDLKPANILVSNSGSPKIADFGLARLSDDASLSRTGEALGTLAYMSPEQLRGRVVDQRSDVYGFGALLFEMLTLRAPFRDDSLERLRERILHVLPPRPEALRADASSVLGAIATRCLEKSPSDRYASMEEVADELRRYLDREPIVARPVSRLRRGVLWTKRNPVRSTVLAAGSLVAVLLAIAGLAYVDANRLREEQFEVAQQLATQANLQNLLQQAEGDALWPPAPEKLPDYADWIRRSDELSSRLPGLEQELAALRQGADQVVAASLATEAWESSALGSKKAWLEGRLAALLAEWRGEPLPTPRLPSVEGLPVPASEDEYGTQAYFLVEPERNRFGSETLGIAFAQAGMKRFPDPASQQVLEYVTAVGWEQLGYLSAAEGSIQRAIELQPDGLYVAELEALRAQIRELRAAADPEPLEEEIRRATPLRPRTPGSGHRFEDRETALLETQTAQLVNGLRDFLEPDRSPRYATRSPHGMGLERRIELARDAERRMAPGGDGEVAWRKAFEELSRESHYEGLPSFQPMSDLVPLGLDMATGLMEFWHPASGARPERNAGGRMALGPEDGLVFVLLAGGDSVQGAQPTLSDAAGFDSLARGDESPVHSTSVGPFLISKFEMTQGQWLRITGENPSAYGPDGTWAQVWARGGIRSSYLLPVESVTWRDCVRWMRRLDLSLPTEAEWEYAARGGSSLPYVVGDRVEDLEGFANILDQYSRNHGLDMIGSGWEPLNDGFSMTAPVGSFEPNAFGLHDVLGNVDEWCLGRRSETSYLIRRGPDPIESNIVESRRNRRGGSYAVGRIDARVSARASEMEDKASQYIGLRPVRRIRP